MTVHAAGACTLLWVRRRTAVSGPGLCGPKASLGGEGGCVAEKRCALWYKRKKASPAGKRQPREHGRQPSLYSGEMGRRACEIRRNADSLPIVLAGSAGLCQRNLCKKNSSCKAASSYTLARAFIQYLCKALFWKRKSALFPRISPGASLPNFSETARVSCRQTVWFLPCHAGGAAMSS